MNAKAFVLTETPYQGEYEYAESEEARAWYARPTVEAVVMGPEASDIEALRREWLKAPLPPERAEFPSLPDAYFRRMRQFADWLVATKGFVRADFEVVGE